MRFSIILALSGLIASIGLDCYILRAIRKRIQSPRVATLVYCIFSGLLYLAIVGAVILPKGDPSVMRVVSWLIFLFVTGFLAKLIFVFFDFLGLLSRLFGRRRRVRAFSVFGIVMAAVAVVLLLWGATINRYRISETDNSLYYTGLPASFDGYRIAQISDLHVGTWANDTSFLSRLVDRLNALDADMIVFTGDIVNSRSSEMAPMVPVLQRLHARDGVYAIMGNHDYGDYVKWPSEEDHIADRLNLRNLYGRTPMRLLLNENVFIHRGDDSIAVIGVENISRPPFRTYGDLSASYPDLSDGVFKVLLSHNPEHWTKDIRDRADKNIALTLSGHTHSMQMQLGGISPGQLVSPTNWGLYTDSLGRRLYVNRGAGTVGLPMRVGATPEISVIELKRK